MTSSASSIKIFICPPETALNVTDEMKKGFVLLANTQRQDCQNAIKLLSDQHFTTYGACATNSFVCQKFEDMNFARTEKDSIAYSMIAYLVKIFFLQKIDLLYFVIRVVLLMHKSIERPIMLQCLLKTKWVSFSYIYLLV